MDFRFAILIILVQLILLWKHFRTGLLFYILASLTFPNIHILGKIITYEIFNFPFIFLFGIYWKKVNLNNNNIILYAYLILLTSSSLISSIFRHIPVGWIAILGVLRFIILFTFMQKCKLTKDNIRNLFASVILINLIVSIIQLTMPSTVDLFYNFYYKDSFPILQSVKKMGFFTRAFGTFGTPVKVGFFSLITISYFLQTYKNKLTDFLIILLALLLGLAALSKTFIIGFPIILILFTISKFNIKRANIFKTTIIIFTFGVVIIYTINYLRNNGFYIDYYLKFIFDPMDAFNTRYGSGSDSGLLSTTFDVIKNNILTGVGTTQVENEFIGDSTYVKILHGTGIIGIILFILFIALHVDYRKKVLTRNLFLIATLLGGLALPVFANIFGAIIFSIIEYEKEN